MIQQSPTERAVMVCPQCEGEGGYPDGLDEAACHTECTRCGGNGWIVDLAALASQAAQPAEADGVVGLIRARKAIYEKKAAESDFLADDDCNRHERMRHTADAFGILLQEIAAATPKAPATDAGEVDEREAVARVISLAKGKPENGQASVGAWWWDARHDRALPEHFEGECRDEDRAHADLMIPLLRRALATPPAPNDDLRAALEENERLRETLEVARVTVRIDAQRLRDDGRSTLQAESCLAAIDAALKENCRG